MTLKPLAPVFAVLGLAACAGDTSAQFAPTARPGYMPNPFANQWRTYNRLAPRWPYPVRPYVRPVPYAVPVPVYVPGATTVINNNSGAGSSSVTGAAAATGAADIRITLPAEGAKISINGTDFGAGVGYDRNLTVPFIPDGHSHDYAVTATWSKDGKEVIETRTVTVKANGKGQANFLVPGK